MKIHVEMDEAEMRDFLQYRKERAGRTSVKERLQELSQKVLWTVSQNEEKQFVVIDQDHAEDLMEMAAAYLE